MRQEAIFLFTNLKLKTQPLDRMISFYSRVQEPLIRCLIRFGEPIDQDALARAVELSMDAVPQIRCTFDQARFVWRKRAFTAADVMRVVAVPDGSSPDPYILSSADWTRAPQMMAYLLRETERDSLVLVVNHVVMDGAGFKQFLYLLAELYTRCANDPAYRGPVAPPGGRELNLLLKNLRLRDKLRILRARTNPARPDPTMRLPLLGDAKNPVLVVTHVDASRFEAIRRYAKGRGASVNDMMLAAYLRTLREITGCSRVAVPCPVDLRRFARPDQVFGACNLTGSYSCGAEIPADEAFSETLSKVSAQMSAQKADDACLKGPMQFGILSHLLPHGAARALFYRLSPPPVVGYTNLGALDDARLRFGRHQPDDAFLSTALKMPPYFQLSISSYRGNCTLTSSLFAAEGDRVLIEKMHARIVREMEDAARDRQNIPVSGC